MKYISTRQNSQPLNFEEVVLQGLAVDGGLYVPEFFPTFSPSELEEMAKLTYPDLAFKIISPFVNGEIPEADLKKIIAKSYESFSHAAIAPTKQLTHNEYLLELFHGPTLAFKDFALQMLGNFFDYFLTKRKQKVTIIGATSGDTGSAAIMGCKACKNADIFILHPYNRVSDVQRKQMTSVIAPNVTNIALKGNFDDCQAMVKKMFSDQSFLKGRKMVAVNSINWARIMVQIVYYFYAGVRVGVSKKNPVTFSVPTGNFGDIYAGYIAKKMGLPISKLIVATNTNDILTRFIKENDYSTRELIDTLSPSMNIQVSSNFERLLFDAHKNYGLEKEVIKLMSDFETTKSLKVGDDILKSITKYFDAYQIDDNETCAIIKDVYGETAEVIDPHTAVGIGAGRKYMKNKAYKGEIIITLATAHPAKFPEAIKKTLGIDVALPNFLSDLMDKEEKMEILPNSLEKVREFISSKH